MADKTSGVFFGVALILLGLTLLATQLGVSIGIEVDARTARFWPVLFVAAGALRVVTSEARRGWGLVFLGAVFLMHTLDVVPLSQSWPLFIVSAGISLLSGRAESKSGREGSGS